MATSHPLDLSTLVQRLGGLPGFNIFSIGQGAEEVVPWYQVDMADVCQQLAIHDTDLARDLGAVAVQVVHWGRLEAMARRVWQVRERQYRSWRSHAALQAARPPPEAGSGWKKPTEGQIDAMVRSHPLYQQVQWASEEAEEAYNAARMVREAFLAKRDMLRVAVRQAHDHSGPRLAV